MNEGIKDGLKAVGAGVGGGGAGAVLYATIGGVGLAATGTAVGLTLGPFITIGAGLGLTSYGLLLAWQTSRHKKKKKSNDANKLFRTVLTFIAIIVCQTIASFYSFLQFYFYFSASRCSNRW